MTRTKQSRKHPPRPLGSAANATPTIQQRVLVPILRIVNANAACYDVPTTHRGELGAERWVGRVDPLASARAGRTVEGSGNLSYLPSRTYGTRRRKLYGLAGRQITDDDLAMRVTCLQDIGSFERAVL
jgi:hypothetical protein